MPPHTAFFSSSEHPLVTFCFVTLMPEGRKVFVLFFLPYLQEKKSGEEN